VTDDAADVKAFAAWGSEALDDDARPRPEQAGARGNDHPAVLYDYALPRQRARGDLDLELLHVLGAPLQIDLGLVQDLGYSTFHRLPRVKGQCVAGCFRQGRQLGRRKDNAAQHDSGQHGQCAPQEAISLQVYARQELSHLCRDSIWAVSNTAGIGMRAGKWRRAALRDYTLDGFFGKMCPSHLAAAPDHSPRACKHDKRRI